MFTFFLKALSPPRKGEQGCVVYRDFQDKHYPGSFFTYEEWENEAALDTHLPVNKQALNKVKALLSGDMSIHVLNPVA